jgi:sulfatase modifying factor 1
MAARGRPQKQSPPGNLPANQGIQPLSPGPSPAREEGSKSSPPPARWGRRAVHFAGGVLVLLVAALLPRLAAAQPAPAPDAENPAGIDWVALDGFAIARTETTVAQFRRYVRATAVVTLAERSGGGQVYEAGWVRKPGWTWARPYGERPAADDEPAVHLGFDEAQRFCRWAGGRLPTDAEWVAAAYTERRAAPPVPFVRGRTYPWPTGDSPNGAQCLGDCGPEASRRAVAHGARLWRGEGHARVGATPAGVNGLHDMGANAWEWVDEPRGARGDEERRTRGGSWWYGSAQMRADHLQGKPPGTTVVYIGFRCAR